MKKNTKNTLLIFQQKISNKNTEMLNREQIEKLSPLN